jgi:hypothetical protein
MRSARALPSVLLVGLFLAALAAPSLDHSLRPERQSLVRTELRNPAPWPAFTDASDWLHAPERLQDWFGDALGLREELVHGGNWLSVFVFRRSPHPNLVLGRKGFVFYGGDGAHETWRGSAPLSAGELAAWADAIRERREAVEALGAVYVLCVAPNKETIYPEFLPAGEEAFGPTPLEQLAALCAERHESAWLDLRPALRAEKSCDDEQQDDHAYLRLGSHWSYRGGWAAASEVARRLAPRVRGLQPLPREAWRALRVDEFNHDDSLTRTMHLDEAAHEPQIEWRRVGGEHARLVSTAIDPSDPAHPTRTETLNEDAGLPSIYLLHDSFGQWIRSPLAELASRTWTRWLYGVPLDEIAELHPDLVLQVITERHLHTPPEPQEQLAQELDALQYAALPLVLAREQALAAVRPYQQTQLARDAEGLRFAVQIGADKLLVPAGPLAAGARPVLQLELELELRSSLILWYQTQADPRFRAHRRVVLKLGPGRAQARIVVPAVNPPGELLLQPASEPGSVRVRSLELRALAAPSAPR